MIPVNGLFMKDILLAIKTRIENDQDTEFNERLHPVFGLHVFDWTNFLLKIEL